MAKARTWAFAWYHLRLPPAALGALAAGVWQRTARGLGARRPRFVLVDALCLFFLRALAVLYSPLPRRLDAPSGGAARTPPRRLGLHRSRGVVFQMSALQALDSLAGGFVAQARLVYWFHGVPGLVSVRCVKYTTARAEAEKAVDLVLQRLRRGAAATVLRRTDLGTAGPPAEPDLEAAASAMASVLGWDERRTRAERQAVRNAYSLQ